MLKNTTLAITLLLSLGAQAADNSEAISRCLGHLNFLPFMNEDTPAEHKANAWREIEASVQLESRYPLAYSLTFYGTGASSGEKVAKARFTESSDRAFDFQGTLQLNGGTKILYVNSSHSSDRTDSFGNSYEGINFHSTEDNQVALLRCYFPN